MLFSKPFPDELAITHLYRIWAMNDISGGPYHIWSQDLAKATYDHRPEHYAHPWTPLYMHQIMACLSGMTPQEYRIRHTMMALTGDWHRISHQAPVKESKIRVYDIELFNRHSAASTYDFRLCNQCRDEDLDLYAMTYWHREHHIAGVDVCPKHQTPLEGIYSTQAHTAPNPVTVQGMPPDETLIRASFHPILTRYRHSALRIIRNPAQFRYTHALEQLLARTHEMGLRRQTTFRDPYSYLQHDIPEYIYSRLPRAWMAQHLSESFKNPGYEPPTIGCSDDYHETLRRIEYSLERKPLFLILALATLFESTEEIDSFFFKPYHEHVGQTEIINNALELALEQ